MTEPKGTFTVVAFYKFADLPEYQDYRQPLFDMCTKAGISGTILLAAEGINGTIAGTVTGIGSVLDHLRSLPGCADLDLKVSHAETNPFYRMKVRLKREIVTMGVAGIDPVHGAGQYVEPEDWNDLINAQDVVLIDTRNDYEVNIGTFKGAINPETGSFRDFPDWLKTRAGDIKHTRVAMFCTGGIRCEKATALARDLGFTDVFHLKGGILNYLETVPEQDSLWQGECFVFDQRVAVGHNLAPGTYRMCHACRAPLNDADRRSPDYVEGISCPRCQDVRNDEQRRRYRERQRQIERAEARGTQHLGATAQKVPTTRGSVTE